MYDESVFDELVGLADEDPVGFMDRLLETFDREASALVAEMERGHDTVSVGRAAHALKGSSATLGARELQELCARIEVASSQGLDSGPSVAALRPALQRVQRLWAQRLARLKR